MTDVLPLARTRRSRAASLIPTTAAILLAAAVVAGLHPTGATRLAASAPGVGRLHAPAVVGAEQIVLRLPDGVATATLRDGTAAQAFAAMLPMTLTLHDPMGQAKSGRLASPLPSDGERILDPAAGRLYYWPPSDEVAIFYDDLGQTVPPPGLVELGRITTGLPAVAAAGNRFSVLVEPA